MYIYVETYIVLLCLKCMKQMQKVHIVDYRKDSYEKKKENLYMWVEKLKILIILMNIFGKVGSIKMIVLKRKNKIRKIKRELNTYQIMSTK